LGSKGVDGSKGETGQYGLPGKNSFNKKNQSISLLNWFHYKNI